MSAESGGGLRSYFGRLRRAGLLMVMWGLVVGSASGKELLRSLAGVRALTTGKAAEKMPVRVEVQVLKFGPERHGFFAHDGEVGIYVSLAERLRERVQLEQGDVVLVSGTSNPGHFLPHIDARELRKLAPQPLPRPMVATRELLADPYSDCQWMEFSGVVLETVRTGQVLSLRLACLGAVYNLVLPRTAEVEAAAEGLVNQAVRCRGVAATQWNSRRQMTGRIFQLHSLKDITVLSGRGTPVPLVPLDQLMRLETSATHSVRVRGVVAHSEGKELYLQDRKNSLMVRLREEEALPLGEEVEVLGTVVYEPFAPVVNSLTVTRRGAGQPLAVREFRAGQEVFEVDYHQSLVAIQARLLSVAVNEEGLELLCESEDQRFVANVHGPQEVPDSLVPDSLVRMRGICLLASSQAVAHVYQADRFSLLLRHLGDVEVLSRPSWWTSGRVLLLASLLLMAILIFLGWVVLLKRKVREQTALIHQQVEREVTMRERERLARDLHDSLEQTIAGLGRQLSNVERRLRSGEMAAVKDGVFLARRMAEHCQKESRESIQDLRQNQRMGKSNYGEDQVLLAEAAQLGAVIDFREDGPRVERDARVERNLTKIVREASYNALRHGGARRVEVRRRELPKGMELTILDEGRGFEVSNGVGRGRFGLQGMRERARSIGAEISIESKVGVGTLVRVWLPN
ncbi:sensor histidine kinase [Roseibacillus ishigakijimensis]|uniref:Histidine kinase/HSP90-like ATPase domain-containing protein n=1 Tax=Roseibacillus ishigakijimensis TaxID=454146 RepID=A0A934RUL4_9BACT|nr:histidine kinase [Roseibacillus ishigakijimensis]MBK1834450.1 hypothetical protein [Roseibacillus ishigakijimensis]